MSDTLDRTLSTEVLAGIIAAPESIARETLAKLEPGDFEHWIDAAIFDALGKVTFADRQVPGSIIIQVNRHLLNAGRFRDTDDGLRAAVVALAEKRGHPQMLPAFTRDLIEQHFRRAMTEHAAALAEHAEIAPLEEITDQLNETITELRRLWARIPVPKTLSTVKETAA